MLKIKPATILSVLSFSISLFVLGFYLLLVIHLSNVIKIVNEKTPFIIELQDSLGNQTVVGISEEIKSIAKVKEIQYISKEDGLQLMKKELGSNIDEISGMNPLKDVLKIKLEEKYISSGGIEKLSEVMKSKPYVLNYYFERDSVEDLRSNLSNLNTVLLIIAIIFIVLSLILIYNNLRFILHADRNQIKTMELIGASPSFLKRPYIKLSLKIGMYSALIALFMIALLLIFMEAKFDISSNFLDTNLTVITMFIILVVSIIVPPLFINYLVIKFLKEGDNS